jgi:hypothetical protein
LIVSEQQTNIVTNSNAVSETIAFASSKIDSQGCVRIPEDGSSGRATGAGTTTSIV